MSAPVRYIRDLGHRKAAMSVRAHELRARLPDAADSLCAQLRGLFDDPTPDRCDRVLLALHGHSTTVRQLASELLIGELPTV